MIRASNHDHRSRMVEVSVTHNQVEKLSRADYWRIRILCLIWSLACGLIDVYCTYKTFAGEVAVIAITFAALSVLTCIFCTFLGKSRYAPIAAAALKIDVALCVLALVAVLVWANAASDVGNARDLDREHSFAQIAYEASVREAAGRLQQAQDRYTACQQNAANGKFSERSKIALACQQLAPDPNSAIYQPAIKNPPVPPAGSAAQAAHDWKGNLRIAAGLGITACSGGIAWLILLLVRAIRLGRVEAISTGTLDRAHSLAWLLAVLSVPNQVEAPAGKQDPIEDQAGNLPLSPTPEPDSSPSLSDPADNAALEAEKAISEAGEAETVRNDWIGQPETVRDCPTTVRDDLSDNLPLSETVRDSVLSTSMPEPEPVLPIEPKRETVIICNGHYKLVPRTPKGWRVRPIPDPSTTDLCSLTEAEAETVRRLSDSDRLPALNEIFIRKGKPPLPVLDKQDAEVISLDQFRKEVNEA